MSHTPGPWAVENRTDRRKPLRVMTPNPIYQGARTGAHIATVIDLYNAGWNAHLIAAAPELLEALRALVALADIGRISQRNGEVNAARAAIAKATGSGR